MKIVKYAIFRYLTNTDFFNIYKPTGTEATGGGQSYIDFAAGSVPLEYWQLFFQGVPSIARTSGPGWTFEIHSIGLTGSQLLTIYRRRPQSFSIAAQRITSRESNRVYAWHPDNGFPEPQDPTDRASCPNNLAIYIIRTNEGEFWAGWFLNNSPCRDRVASSLLRNMLPKSPVEGYDGFIAPSSTLYIDESDIFKPFFT